MRNRTAGSTQSQPPNPLPWGYDTSSWVRLQRIGTTFYSSCSSDALNWAPLYQFDSVADSKGPFSNPAYLGIATSSWSAKETVQATVSDFGATQTVPPSTMVSLALLEYWSEDLAKAAELCRRCLASDYQAAHVATAHILLALCCQRSERPAEARTELEQGRRIVQAHSMGGEPGNAANGYWYDWACARTLVLEADRPVNNPFKDKPAEKMHNLPD